MGSITKATTAAGDRRWRARYRDPSGRQRERWFSRKVDAESFLAHVEHQKRAGTYLDPSAGRVTFRAYAEEWRTHQVHHRASTSEGVERSLRLHAYPVLGDRPIGAVSRSEVQGWVKGLDLAPSTAELVYRHVAAVFRSAVEDRVIPVSPCRRIALPEKPRSEVVIPTADQVTALLGAMPDRYRTLPLLVATSGLRPSEARGLTADRVDWLRRTITVDRQLRYPEGFVPPKTKASHRTIPVPDVTLQALTEHRRAHDVDADLPGLLFATPNGKPVHSLEWSRIWRPAARVAGLEPGTGLHVLRHRYASALIHGGESVKVVQARLGHASAKETLDVYGHLWPASEERTREAASQALAGVVWG